MCLGSHRPRRVAPAGHSTDWKRRGNTGLPRQRRSWIKAFPSPQKPPVPGAVPPRLVKVPGGEGGARDLVVVRDVWRGLHRAQGREGRVDRVQPRELGYWLEPIPDKWGDASPLRGFVVRHLSDEVVRRALLALPVQFSTLLSGAFRGLRACLLSHVICTMGGASYRWNAHGSSTSGGRGRGDRRGHGPRRCPARARGPGRGD